jgi:membrane-associated phospholipid phosphatase
VHRALIGLLGLLLVPTARGAEARPGDAAVATARHDDGRRTLRRLPANLLRSAAGLFAGDNVAPFLVGGTATAAASFFDEDVAEYVADPDHDFGQSLEDGASPEVVGLAVAGVFAASRFAASERLRAMSYDLLDAFVVTWAYTNVLKVAVDRERPNREDAKSFPSGHASNAFALATVAERHYGWKAGVPAYALASAVAVSRLQRNKHYLTDVMAGATLGYLVGRTVVRVNGGPLDVHRGPQLSLSPVLGHKTRAVRLAVSF